LGTPFNFSFGGFYKQGQFSKRFGKGSYWTNVLGFLGGPNQKKRDVNYSLIDVPLIGGKAKYWGVIIWNPPRKGRVETSLW